MELLSAQFFSALLAIIVIDLVLAGDNAIVIALAARSLPPHLQRRAILWGAAGAIAVRSAMTLIVVWLLSIPGLLGAGGALLVWIAYRLLAPENGEAPGAHEVAGHEVAAVGFWGAMKTIVVADAIMGLDNVLAVAGAAHGSYLLVVLGLLISVPIIIWGSTLILAWVKRYPAIVYLGAGVLAWTAVKMMVSEPLLKNAIAAANGAVVPVVYLVVVGGVLWLGFVRNHRRLASRITARLAAFERERAAARGRAAETAETEESMERVLVPVDGSRNAEYAVRHVLNEFRKNPAMQVHLLHVRRPLPWHIAQFLSGKTRESFHREEAEKALAPARRLLEQLGVPHSARYRLGESAASIVDEAQSLRCHRIVMSAARRNSLTRMLQDSVTHEVLEKTTIPVEVTAGDAVSGWERYGVPAAAMGTALALLLAAAAD